MLLRDRVPAGLVDAWIERVEDGLVRGCGVGENHAIGGELVELGSGVPLRIVATAGEIKIAATAYPSLDGQVFDLLHPGFPPSISNSWHTRPLSLPRKAL